MAEDSFQTIDIPDIKAPDISYGYDAQPIYGTQIDPSNNRNISGVQYFAFKVNLTTGPGGTASPQDIIFTGSNGDLNKTYTGVLFYKGLGAGNEVGGTFTKKYTTDTYYENNILGVGSQVNGVIRVKSGGVCEISAFLNFSTQILNFATVAGSYTILNGSSLTFDSSNTTKVCTIINIGTRELQLKMQYLTISAGERPSFGCFIKIF